MWNWSDIIPVPILLGTLVELVLLSFLRTILRFIFLSTRETHWKLFQYKRKPTFETVHFVTVCIRIYVSLIHIKKNMVLNITLFSSKKYKCKKISFRCIVLVSRFTFFFVVKFFIRIVKVTSNYKMQLNSLIGFI